MSAETATVEETVLVKANGYRAKGIFHLPDPDDPARPKCGQNINGRSAFVEKTREMLPGARCCKHCEGTGGWGGFEGTRLATKLQRIGKQEDRAQTTAAVVVLLAVDIGMLAVAVGLGVIV